MAFLKLLRQSPVSARIGMGIVLLNVVVALLAPVIAPYGETEVVGDIWLTASPENFVGTDHLGRDMLSRLIWSYVRIRRIKRLSEPCPRVDAAVFASLVERVGLTDENAMDVPQAWMNTGWYSPGFRPGEVGNAVIADADLSREYFGEESRRVTHRGLCLSMACGNLLSFLLGGMPLCHGAGGLAAHFRFGARTAGSNLMIGAIFTALAILLGRHCLAIIYLLPLSVLGVLLLFAGSQLALTILDLKNRKELFVCLIMLGITLATNLAAGFIAGIAVAYLLKFEKLDV